MVLIHTDFQRIPTDIFIRKNPCLAGRQALAISGNQGENKGV
jgi:hypothetical protein